MSAVATKNQRKQAAQRVSQNVTNKPLAATLYAESEMLPEGESRKTDQEIADAVGVTRRTVLRWKQDSEFQAMVQDAQGKIIADALRLPSAQKFYRIRQMNQIIQRLLTALDLRGETYSRTSNTPEEAARQLFGDGVPPWAATGLFIERKKMSATGRVVSEWEMDTALIREIRASFEHVARETGQWTEQSKVEMDGGVRIELVGIADEDMP